MIGADEFCTYDQHGNVITVRRSKQAHDEAKAEIAALGFKMSGNTVFANRRDVEQAWRV